MDITAFMITGASGKGSSPWFEPKVNVAFFQLDFPHQELPDVPGIKGMPARLANLRVLYSGVVHAAVGPQILTGPDGGPVLLSRAPSQILLDVPVGAVKLRLGFGLMENTWKTGASDGVEFRVSKVTDDNHLIPLWSRALDPVHREEDRAEQQAAIDLPADAAPRLLLEALPRRENGGDHSYWSRATFDQLGNSFDSASSEELATPH